YHNSLKNAENTRKLVSEQMTYEFDKKQAALKADQDKKDAVVAEEKKKQEVVIYAVSAVLVLVVILAVFIFRGSRQKQKANELLEDKNKTIEEQKQKVDAAYDELREKHKEIT